MHRESRPPVRIIHVKDLILNLPEFCDVFLQSRDAGELHAKKHLAFALRRRSVFARATLINECVCVDISRACPKKDKISKATTHS